MYHASSPHIIEGSDIHAVHELHVEHHENGKKYLHMTAELDPQKHYEIPESPLDEAKRPVRSSVEHMLHVTDGVTPRILSQQHAYPKKGVLPAPGSGGVHSMSLEEAQKHFELPKGTKSRK